MKGNSEKLYNEYVIEIVASIIEQRQSFLKSIFPSWEKIYKISDYHHVSNIVYYKIMWSDDSKIKNVRKKFEQRYQYCLQLHNRYEKLREILETELEKEKIDSLFLSDSIYLPYYKHKEMRMPQYIQVLISKDRLNDISKIMENMGFLKDEKQDSETNAVVYKKNYEIKIEFYEELDFEKPKVKRFFRGFLMNNPRKKNKNYIRQMNRESIYLYTICNIAQRYSQGNIELRDIVDLWVFLSSEWEYIRWRKVIPELDNMRLRKFSNYILKLVQRWFDRVDFTDDDTVLDNMEEYIMHKGEKSRKENEKILPLVKRLVDNYREFIDFKNNNIGIK